MKNFAILLFGYFWKTFSDIIMPLYQAWKEVDGKELNEEMKGILKKYQATYLKFSWNVFWDLMLFMNGINLFLVILFYGQKITFRIIVRSL